jgi:hypothetical protein
MSVEVTALLSISGAYADQDLDETIQGMKSVADDVARGRMEPREILEDFIRILERPDGPVSAELTLQARENGVVVDQVLIPLR